MTPASKPRFGASRLSCASGAPRWPASPATPPDSEVVLRLSAGIREIYGIEPHCDGSGGGTVAVGFRDMGIPAAVWASVVPTYHLANEYSLISRTIGDAQVLARMLFD